MAATIDGFIKSSVGAKELPKGRPDPNTVKDILDYIILAVKWAGVKEL